MVLLHIPDYTLIHHFIT